jgi:transcriptional regulator with XRE-family HTH domain
MDTDTSIGARLRAARDAKGLTRAEFAPTIGLGEQYLYQIEAGRRAANLETLFKLAVALGLDPNALDPRLVKMRPRGGR